VWNIDTPWFDVAVVGVGFAVGNILFGRFEEHRSRWRRVVKLALTLTITLVLARTVGRGWAYGWMTIPLVLAAWVHLVWLPRQGVSGWTAEPRAKYIDVVTRAKFSDLWRRGEPT
jgi:predicted MFS family arabinose efflux permease